MPRTLEAVGAAFRLKTASLAVPALLSWASPKRAQPPPSVAAPGPAQPALPGCCDERGQAVLCPCRVEQDPALPAVPC
jgi:hypothetical protein